ncbi:MAG: AAA family ATPase [Desulfomonilaceae bacterium]
MLIEFSVGNYKSIREKVTLSMVAAAMKSKDRSVDENNVIDVGQKLRLLASAAIYGANASGKSNLISAMDFMKTFVQISAKDTQASDKISTDSFRLSTEFDQKPSHFEVVFLLEGKRYRYGFEVNTDRIISEWLYYTPKSREATLFERNLDDIYVCNYFKEGKGLIRRTRSNALFLAVVAQWNGAVATKLLEWFHYVGVLFDMGSALPYFAFDHEEIRRSTLQLIKAMDIDIIDFSVEEIPSQDSAPSVSIGGSVSTDRSLEVSRQ